MRPGLLTEILTSSLYRVSKPSVLPRFPGFAWRPVSYSKSLRVDISYLIIIRMCSELDIVYCDILRFDNDKIPWFAISVSSFSRYIVPYHFPDCLMAKFWAIEFRALRKENGMGRPNNPPTPRATSCSQRSIFVYVSWSHLQSYQTWPWPSITPVLCPSTVIWSPDNSNAIDMFWNG